MVNEQLTPDRREEGSIGIGAMIVFIALILVAAVASTIIIKTAEELQQNAGNTSRHRQQISEGSCRRYVKPFRPPFGGRGWRH
ncbi:MAG: hypothetical protein CM15mP6_4250 [Methanobacteriota archaeon]|nr:MAG: hypothetical protein CM15mP6_4250 [Euryarchaeota archaeon]